MTRTWTPAVLFLLFAATVPAAWAQEAAVAVQASQGPTIKDAYQDHFFIGMAGDLPGNYSAQELGLVQENFNFVTPENCMKPGPIHPGEDSWRFERPDALVQWCLDNHLAIHGHTLVWHAQTNDWFFRDGDKAAVTRRMKDHIRTLVGRYKGKVRSWDVVNEAISDGGNSQTAGTENLRNSPWLRALGPEYLTLAFQFAHEADPDATLYYNDYGIEAGPKHASSLVLLKRLIADGDPVHGVGIQGHWSTAGIPYDALDKAIADYASLGLKVSITELDVTIRGSSGGQFGPGFGFGARRFRASAPPSPQDLQAQADAYARLFAILIKHKDAVERVTFWGLSDRRTWRFGQHPLIFDGNNQRKPAYAAIVDVVRDPNDAGQPARNPIIWADVPDLAAIRVGDTYYLSSTTMHLNPGLPIMKSTDLVNWQLVGYAYNTLGDNDALALRNGKNAYGAGSWASSLRYHDGTFYATTFSSTTGKTHVYRTKDIEKGPWTENSFRPALHDHTLFFDDDGRVYMIYGGGNLRLVELTADVSGLKPGGVDQVVIPNASRVAGPNIGLPAEGSQLWKIDGKYYLFNITWPRGGMRTVLVHRADHITGPYEGHVALQDKGVAQGGLIDTPQGDWYAYLFRDYGAVGRVPYLVPVRWEDGWPVLGVDGKVPDTLSLPASKGPVPGIIASDEFDRRPGDPALPPVWQWNHNPDNNGWSLTQRPGFLRLTGGRVDGDFLSAQNTLTQRTFGPECCGTVCLDVSHMQAGDVAGLGALQQRYGLVAVKREGDAKSIVMVSAESGSPVEMDRVALTQDVVYLKLECDFRDRAGTARFFHSLDGRQWTAIGKPLRMKYTLPHFMGYRFALFHYATKTAGGCADFDYFRVSDKTSAAITTANAEAGRGMRAAAGRD